ncbi:hypothetical protein ACRC7T_08540 [Segnochrobactraceae bacterium EtOH-i3]
MIRTRLLSTAVALATATLLLGPAFAGDVTPPTGTDPFGPAWDDLVETEGTLLTTPQFAALTNLAYQTAVVRVCDTHALDRDKVTAVLNGLLAIPPEKTLTEAQTQERTAAILMAFGARYGLFLAEAHTNTASFCKAADDLKAAPDDVPILMK